VLQINDCASNDTGSVTAAVLTLDSGTTQAPRDANVDMNGDGKTDFVVTRATETPLAEARSGSRVSVNRGAASYRERLAIDLKEPLSENLLAPPIYWYTSVNGTGSTSVTRFGDAATDFLTPEDFDGDGKDDVAVWRPGAAGSAAFYILQSEDSTVRTDVFGQDNDDPLVVGDYDDDNKADPAVFRCPTAAVGPCYFFYRGSNNNPNASITYVQWGTGIVNATQATYFANPGDFDGDGKFDFCLQRANPLAPERGQFALLRSSDLGAEFIDWGLSSDFILPGDYDGDGKSDFCVRRTENLNGFDGRSHYILERDGGGTGASPIRFGSFGDISVPGDYDGDGQQDIAIWRPSSQNADNNFWVLNSGDKSVTRFEWGQCPTPETCDYPVANWYVH
ncbi:MAG: VCBS repeat-containing protein, partial [Pyrinomonadaceae bacterium]